MKAIADTPKNIDLSKRADDIIERLIDDYSKYSKGEASIEDINIVSSLIWNLLLGKERRNLSVKVYQEIFEKLVKQIKQ